MEHLHLVGNHSQWLCCIHLVPNHLHWTLCIFCVESHAINLTSSLGIESPSLNLYFFYHNWLQVFPSLGMQSNNWTSPLHSLDVIRLGSHQFLPTITGTHCVSAVLCQVCRPSNEYTAQALVKQWIHWSTSRLSLLATAASHKNKDLRTKTQNLASYECLTAP